MSKWNLTDEECAEMAETDLVKSVYMSAMDTKELDPMEDLGLAADESVQLLQCLSWLHQKNGTHPIDGESVGSEEIQDKLISSGGLIEITDDMMHSPEELMKKLKEL